MFLKSLATDNRCVGSLSIRNRRTTTVVICRSTSTSLSGIALILSLRSKNGLDWSSPEDRKQIDLLICRERGILILRLLGKRYKSGGRREDFAGPNPASAFVGNRQQGTMLNSCDVVAR